MNLASVLLAGIVAPILLPLDDTEDHRAEGEAHPVRRLTTTDARNGQLAFAPDGKSIAFVSNRDGSWQLYVMSAEGRDVHKLTDLPHSVGWPSWEPAGDRLLFYATSPDRSRFLAIGLPDGEAEEVHDRGVQVYRPEVSPDGARILFDSVSPDADGPWHQVWVMDADGSNPTQLTTGRAYHSDARWSPDGQRIAYHSGEHGPSDAPFDVIEIQSMKTDGSDRRRLTHDGARNTYPAWSPDGEQLAFTKRRGADTDIWIMQADGSDPRQVTHHPGIDTTPCWSPDGARLYFASDRNAGSEDIYHVELSK